MSKMKNDGKENGNVIQITCSDEEYAFLKEHADYFGIPMEDYVKAVAFLYSDCMKNDVKSGNYGEHPFGNPENVRNLIQHALRYPNTPVNPGEL